MHIKNYIWYLIFKHSQYGPNIFFITPTAIISSTLTTFTPCVSGEIMSNPAALPSTKIYINPQPISPYTAENLRPGSTAPLEINSNTATISMDLTTTDNPDGSVIKSLNIVGDQSNVEKISVSYKVTPTSTSQDFTSFVSYCIDS